MRHSLRLACLCLVGLLATRAARAQTPPLRLVVSSGLQGDIARIACVSAGERSSGLTALSRALSQRSGEDVLRLDAGDLFGSSALAHLASSRGRGRSRRAACARC